MEQLPYHPEVSNLNDFQENIPGKVSILLLGLIVLIALVCSMVLAYFDFHHMDVLPVFYTRDARRLARSRARLPERALLVFTGPQTPSDEICYICFEKLSTGHIGQPACGHRAHAACLRTWFTVSPGATCPICRR